MSRAVHCLVRAVVVERKALVRTGCRKADNVAGGTDAARDTLAELEQHAGRIRIRIGDRQGLVRLEIGDIGKAVGRVIDPGRSWRSLGFGRYHRGHRRSGGGKASATQKSAAAGIDHFVAMAHRRPPTARRYAYRRRFLGDDRYAYRPSVSVFERPPGPAGPGGDMSRRLDMFNNGNVLACHLSVI